MLDHFQNTQFKYDRLQMLIIDEADRILQIGFEDTMRGIVRHLPRESWFPHALVHHVRIGDIGAIGFVPPRTHPLTSTFNTHTHTHTHSLSLSLSLSVPVCLSVSLSLPKYNPTENRQTVLFSATQTRKVEDLARISLRGEPLYIGVDDTADVATADGIEQGYVVSFHALHKLSIADFSRVFFSPVQTVWLDHRYNGVECHAVSHKQQRALFLPSLNLSLSPNRMPLAAVADFAVL